MSKKQKLTRRDFLKEVSKTTMALPLLNTPVALGQTTTAPVRLLLVPLAHGWGNYPEGDGSGSVTSSFNLPLSLQPFEQIRNHLTIIDGLRGTYWGNAHDVSYSDIFTASVPAQQNSSQQLGTHFPMPTGPSIDWFLGNRLNKRVLRMNSGYRSWGKQYNPLYFDNNLNELPQFTSAAAGYSSVVDLLQTSQLPNDPNLAMRQSLFSFLGNDVNRFMARLSGTQRQKANSYLQALNDLGMRINSAPPPVLGTVDPNDIPARFTSSRDSLADARNSLDLIKLAFQADTHRIACLGLGQSPTSNFSWRDSNGVVRTGNTTGGSFHHEIAHYNNKEANRELAFRGWVAANCQLIVDFVRNLENTIDVDGKPLIENTIIVLTGEVGTGTHDTRRKMHVVIGGGGGTFRKGGQLIRIPTVEARNRQGFFLGRRLLNGDLHTNPKNYGSPFSSRTHADLFVTIANIMGVNINQFGMDVLNNGRISLI